MRSFASKIARLGAATVTASIGLHASVSLPFSVSHCAPEIPDCKIPSCASKAELFAKSLSGLGKPKKQPESGESKKDSNSNNNGNGSENNNSSNSNGSSNSNESSSNSSNGSNSSASAAPASSSGKLAPAAPLQCPLDREELGRSAWDLIHTVAAFYPESPTDAEQAAARSLIISLAVLYPCPICAADLRSNVLSNPPNVESRTAFALWCCNLHNEVSKKLHKPTFKCDMESLDKRWRDGPECWNQLFDEHKEM